MNYSKLSKDVLAVIKPSVWNSYYLVSVYLRKAYERILPKLLEDGKKYDILDYGCGVKPYYYLFEKNIKNYIGIDIGENPFADQRIEPDEKLKFDDNSFDFVLSSQVLEHVQDYEDYVSECYRVLRPGGYLLLSTHGTWQYHSSPYDFHRWTSFGLKSLIEKHKFQVTDFVPMLGQLAVTSQLRLSFFDSFANMIGIIGRIILAPVAMICQFKMLIEDLITPQRVKDRDSAIYLIVGKKT